MSTIETYAPLFIVEIGGSKIPEDISSHIEAFSYEENEKKMDELNITISKGDMSFVDNSQLQEGKEIKARWGYTGNLSETRTCTIKEINYSFGEDGVVRMEITAYDKRHRLTGRAPRTCYKDKSISDIVRDIANKHNLTPKIELDDDFVYDFLSQGTKNDLIFLKELAEDAGCSVWVVNDELHFKPNKINEPVYSFSYNDSKEGLLQSFRITSKAESGKAAGRLTEAAGIEPMTKKEFRQGASQGNSSSSGTSKNSNSGVVLVALGDKSVPEKREGNETPLSAKHDESGKVIASPVHDESHAGKTVKGKVKTSSMKSVEAEAVTIGLPYLKARECITIQNIGKKFSGNWRIVSVKHEISNSGYLCSLNLTRNDHSGNSSSSGKTTGNPPKTVKSNSTNPASQKQVKSSEGNSRPPVKVNLN